MKVALLLCACFYSAFSYDIQPPIPIPKPEHGLRHNPSIGVRPEVKLEIFIDLHCSDSAISLPILKNVQQHYDNSQLDLIVQLMPLPYFPNSFLAAQGLFVVESLDPFKVEEYIDANFANIANFTSENTKDMTETEIIDMLADLAFQSAGVNTIYFKNDIDNWYSHVSSVWKYGAKRSVALTPSYFVNGVELGIGTSIPTYTDWLTFLDPIINS